MVGHRVLAGAPCAGLVRVLREHRAGEGSPGAQGLVGRGPGEKGLKQNHRHRVGAGRGVMTVGTQDWEGRRDGGAGRGGVQGRDSSQVWLGAPRP